MKSTLTHEIALNHILNSVIDQNSESILSIDINVARNFKCYLTYQGAVVPLSTLVLIANCDQHKSAVLISVPNIITGCILRNNAGL